MSRSLSAICGLVAVGALLIATSGVLAAVPFFQGFETDTAGWNQSASSLAVRVPSGTDGITSKSGGYHGILHPGSPGSYGYGMPSYPFTRFDLTSYSDVWPGYTWYQRLDFYLDNNITEGLTWQEELWWNNGIRDSTGAYQGESSVRLRKNDTDGNWDLRTFSAGGPNMNVVGIDGDQWVSVYHIVRESVGGFMRNDVVIKDQTGAIVMLNTGTTAMQNGDGGGNYFGWAAIWDPESTVAGAYPINTVPSDWAPGYGIGIPVDNTRAITMLAGDANLDDVVNILDLSVMSTNWQATTTRGWYDGDFNEDGTVNILDLSMLSGNWQANQAVSAEISFEGASSAADLGGVPEPGSLLLLAAGGLMMLRRRR